MGWISGLTGLSTQALITVIIVAILTSIPNIIKLVNVFKSRKIDLGKLDERGQMLAEGETALNDCKAIIESSIPKEFNEIQKWILGLMLWKAFMGACRLYIKGLVLECRLWTMTDYEFDKESLVEAKRVMRAVSTSLTEEWQGREGMFPMSREKYQDHNYAKCGTECSKIIIGWFKYCRAIKNKEKGVT